MEPEEVVVAFADHLATAVMALRREDTGTVRDTPDTAVLFETGNGVYAGPMILAGVGKASILWKGCLVEFSSGAEIFFDWDDQYSATFDGWRLRRFALSIGERDASLVDLILAATRDPRLIEVKPGRFTLELLARPRREHSPGSAAGSVAIGETPSVGPQGEVGLADRWWLYLTNDAVAEIEVDDLSVTITFESRTVVTIKSSAELGDFWSQRRTPAVTIHPDGTIWAFDNLLLLVGQRVASAAAFKSGDLRLVFESEAFLSVLHHQAHEAWQLSESSGRLWASLPGGGLAVSPPQD